MIMKTAAFPGKFGYADVQVRDEALAVTSLLHPEGIQLSGVIAIESTGTAVQGPDVECTSGFYIRGHAENNATIYVGNDGNDDVSPDTGFPLSNSRLMLKLSVFNLNQVWFDADEDPDPEVTPKVCWIKA